MSEEIKNGRVQFKVTNFENGESIIEVSDELTGLFLGYLDYSGNLSKLRVPEIRVATFDVSRAIGKYKHILEKKRKRNKIISTTYETFEY